MKLFHLSDLHIGIKLNNREIYEDQRYVFEQIFSYAREHKPDVIIIAGDIYDKSVPSAKAVEMFDSFLYDLRDAVPDAEIMMISGNHDSPERLNQYRSFLNRQRIHAIGIPPQEPDEFIEKVVLKDDYGDVNFYLLPFIRPYMVNEITQPGSEDDERLSYDEAVHKMLERENIDTSVRNVLVSHQAYVPEGFSLSEIERADSETIMVGNIEAVCGDILQIFDYAALGHFHKPMQVSGMQWRYCGTPMPYSVSERDQEKGIVMVELGAKGNVTTRVLPLKPLHKIRVIKDTLEEALKQSCDDYVCVSITDSEDMPLFDLNNRLRAAFPNLLGTPNLVRKSRGGSAALNLDDDPDIMQQCAAFLGEINEEERVLLEDVINTVLEGKK